MVGSPWSMGRTRLQQTKGASRATVRSAHYLADQPSCEKSAERAGVGALGQDGWQRPNRTAATARRRAGCAFACWRVSVRNKSPSSIQTTSWLRLVQVSARGTGHGSAWVEVFPGCGRDLADYGGIKHAMRQRLRWGNCV